MNTQEETVEVPESNLDDRGMRQQLLGSKQITPRQQMAAISDEGKDSNHNRDHRVEIRAVITAGKQRNAHEGPI
jgi:hypothetical protein